MPDEFRSEQQPRNILRELAAIFDNLPTAVQVQRLMGQDRNKPLGSQLGADVAQMIPATPGEFATEAAFAAVPFAGKAIPAPAKKAVGRAVNPAVDAIRSKKWFHGTGTKGLQARDMDPFFGSHESLQGQGVYLTDAAEDIPQGYARSRGKKTGTPTVYEAKVDVSDVLDLEQPAPAEVRKAFQDIRFYGDDDVGRPALDAALRKADATAEELVQALRDDIRDASWDLQVSTSEYVDTFQDLTVKLRELGYDALTHTGGKRTGKAPHQVLIMLDPHDAYSQVGRGGQIVDWKELP